MLLLIPLLQFYELFEQALLEYWVSVMADTGSRGITHSLMVGESFPAFTNPA